MTVYTVDEAARYLRVDRQLVYDLVRSGRLKGVKVGRIWRIPRTALESLLGASVITEPTGQVLH